MGGKSSDAPAAPDFTSLAEEQSRLNRRSMREQTMANRPDQITPWGQVTWERGRGGQWTQNVTLPEQQQAALESRQRLGQGLMGMAEEEMLQPIGWDPMTANEVGTGAETRARVEDAIYGRATSRLDPYWEEERTRVEGQLYNQGLRPGDEAWDTAMGNLERGRTDAYQTAMSEATRLGGAEAQREYEMDMGRRQQAISEALRRRSLPISEANLVAAGAPGMPTMPGFKGAGVTGSPDLMGAGMQQYQAQVDAYNADQAQQQGLMSGLFGMAAATSPYWGPALFSDRSLKEDVTLVGQTKGGQNFYMYTRDGCVEFGVMADESPQDAVIHGNLTGKDLVDYSRIN